jgi:hypothetical protein
MAWKILLVEWRTIRFRWILLTAALSSFGLVLNTEAFAVPPGNEQSDLALLQHCKLNNLPCMNYGRCMVRFAGSPCSTSSSSPSGGRRGPLSALAMLPTNNDMEVGIQTAQLLLDPRRRQKLKDQMQQKFPLVPDAVLDSSIDITAQAFTKVAPEKLKIALRPGGMDKVRPELERVIVRVVLDQPAIQSIPVLNSKDKKKLVEAVVTMALDNILKNAQEVLAAPEVRLEALEAQVREVKAMMGPWRLFLYRLRHVNPQSVVAFLTLSVASIVMYQQRNLPAIATLIQTISLALSQLKNLVSLAGTKIGTATHLLGNYLAKISSFLQKLFL